MLKRSIERRPLLTGLIAGLCLGEPAWAQQCSSLNGTLVTTVGPTIIDSSQESFALNGSAQITVGGVIDATSSNVVALLYLNGLVYKKVGVNVASNSIPYGYDYYDWYFKAVSTAPWSGKVCDPRLPLPTAFIDITAAPYNAVGNGSTDNQTAIQNALTAAGSSGPPAVRVPAGTFDHSGSLSIPAGVTLFGTGNASILQATTNANSALQLSGSGGFITCLWVQCPNTARLTGPYQAAGIWPSAGCSNHAIQNVVINGSACPAVYSETGSYGLVQYNTVLNCWSDSITQTFGTTQCTVNGNRIYNSGDDCISNNTYPGDPSVVSNIVITGNSAILNKFARGFEVSGGSNITFNGNFHVQSPSTNPLCNMWFATEDTADTGFNTQAVTNCTAKNNCLVNGGANQGAILIGAWNATYSITGLTIANNEIIGNASNPVQIEGGTLLTGTLTGTLVYETNTGQAFANNTGTNTSGFAISGTTTHTLASWPGTYSVTPGGGCGTIGAPGYTSPQGFVVNKASARVGYAVIDGSLNAFSINPAGNITANGTVIAGTSDLAFLLMWGGSVYQMNHSNNWFGPVTTSSGGSATTDPRL